MSNFNPLPVEEHRKRYPLAIERIYDQERVADGLEVKPGYKSEHKFDFQNGVRLIISREKTPYKKKLVIHISGRKYIDENTLAEIEPSIMQEFVECFSLISGSQEPLEVIGVTQGKVCHFYWRIGEEKNA